MTFWCTLHSHLLYMVQEIVVVSQGHIVVEQNYKWKRLWVHAYVSKICKPTHDSSSATARVHSSSCASQCVVTLSSPLCLRYVLVINSELKDDDGHRTTCAKVILTLVHIS